MATAPTYITHKELKRIFPQIDEFDQKTSILGWETTGTSNLYLARNSGLVTVLFADGEDLGDPEANSGVVNVNGEWYYDSNLDTVYYFNSAASPVDLLMEAGEDFATMITQFRGDASRYLDSKLDPNMPKEQLKDKSGNYDYIIIRTAGLIASAFLIRTNDPTNAMATAFMEEAEANIAAINDGKAALSWQTTRDSSRGVIRDVTYTGSSLRPVDTRGRAGGVDYDLVKLKIGTGGVLGTATYNVYVKDSDGLKNHQVVTNEEITGDYQDLAHGLQIRFAGETDSTAATANDEWEIEVVGRGEEVDASGAKSVRNTRWNR
tara:strand:- start:639 stop:1598 length:960 start_codon:yes stop_codon:yes gene_type:complete